MPSIHSIIEQMTLEEKAALCTGASAWTTVPVERLGVPEMVVSDGPHGVRRIPNVHEMGSGSLPATCFPTASCLAATWDVDLLHTMGEALGEECISLKVDVLLGPGANMKRSPLGGAQLRIFLRGPLPGGRDSQESHPRRAEPGRGHFVEALRRQQPGIPAHDGRHLPGRARPA